MRIAKKSKQSPAFEDLNKAFQKLLDVPMPAEARKIVKAFAIKFDEFFGLNDVSKD